VLLPFSRMDMIGKHPWATEEIRVHFRGPVPGPGRICLRGQGISNSLSFLAIAKVSLAGRCCAYIGKDSQSSVLRNRRNSTNPHANMERKEVQSSTSSPMNGRVIPGEVKN